MESHNITGALRGHFTLTSEPLLHREGRATGGVELLGVMDLMDAHLLLREKMRDLIKPLDQLLNHQNAQRKVCSMDPGNSLALQSAFKAFGPPKTGGPGHHRLSTPGDGHVGPSAG
jgi:hypothetical protein